MLKSSLCEMTKEHKNNGMIPNRIEIETLL